MADDKVYVFCKSGIVQYITLDNREGMAVARGSVAAKKIKDKYDISPALVGSLEGETMTAHINAAIANGVKGIWTLDGDKWHWFAF